jgi:hypothetical protein
MSSDPKRQPAHAGALPGWMWGLVGLSFVAIAFLGANDLRDALRATPADDTGAAEHGEWQALLAGRVLSAADAGASAGSENRHALHLCSDATYHLETGAREHGGRGAIGGSAVDAGYWDVQADDAGALLLLRSEHGGVSAHPVSLAGGETRVGGRPVVMTASARCH